MLTESYYHDTRFPLNPYTLPELWERAAEQDEGTKVTWVEPYEELGHKERYNLAMQIAKGLLAVGLKRGDTLCCFGSRGSDPLLMFYACTSLGIKFMCSYLYPPVDKLIRNIIIKAEPDAVLIGDNTCHDSTPAASNFIEAIKQLASEETTHKIRHVIYDRKAEADSACPKLSDWTSLSSIMKEGPEKISDEVLIASKALVEKNEPCVYSLSSGSTGEIKLVVLGAAALTNNVLHGKLGVDKYLKVFGTPDISSEDFGIYGSIVQCMGCSYDLVVFPVEGDTDEDTSISNVPRYIEKYRVNALYLDQYYIMKIVNEPELRKGYDLSSLKCIVTVGNLVGAEFKKRMLEIAPLSLDLYGSTEFFQSVRFQLGSLMLRPTSVGQPCPNIEAKVIDENGDIVPVNTRGQLLLRGYARFIEYKDQPELTAAAIDKDGWYKTGDMVSMDEAGYLSVYGRMAFSQRWKVASDVVYAVSIESVLRRHPSIRTCMAVGTQNPDALGHEINYVVEPTPDSGLTVEEVRAFAMKEMNCAIEWPMRIFMYSHEQLPITTGARRKLNRKALQEEIEARVAKNPKDMLLWDRGN